jgi:hypothetical protein
MEASSRYVVLLCEGCGERVVLGGPEQVWRSGCTFFKCECGQRLTLSNRLEPVEGIEKGVEASSALLSSLHR